MRAFLLYICLIGLHGCQRTQKKPIEQVSLTGTTGIEAPELLSEWKLFQEPLSALKPIKGIIPYDLNTPLFSDYAFKLRFVKLPKGKSAEYNPTEVLDFPQGTILIKNFYYPQDFQQPEGKRRIIETRLLIHEGKEWEALTYVWNEEQTEAYLEIAGRSVHVEWKDKEGLLQNVNYSVPNLVQCKSCHDKSGRLIPIGPTARQLNKEYSYASGKINQLSQWEKLGLLSGVPPESEWPMFPVWDDPVSGTLDKRARAWLEINCAHCHSAEGPARNTGLYLKYDEDDDYKVGFHKPPVAAGRGSGGLKYSIVPGDPEASILVYRIQSLDPGVMMPEVGRKLRDEDGINLIREWISSMKRLE